VAPSSAFVEKSDGSPFVTHGFFLWAADNSAKTLDDITVSILHMVKTNSPRIQTDPNDLTRLGSPNWSSCGKTLDPGPPYIGTETGLACSYRIGTHTVAMLMFSPTNAGDETKFEWLAASVTPR
jgi:hypothetical protein